MKVEQFYNKNQFHIIQHEKAHCIDYLQSYNSLVVKVDSHITKGRIITLGCDWDYSTTTSKHVYLFLEEYADINFYGISNKRAYVNKLIKDGTIIYDEKMI